MFVLPPPPPRYPLGGLSGVPGASLIETNNTLHHHEGPQYQLILGEGTYVQRDEIHLATPPPHPSDVPVPNSNPLATTIGPPTSGVRCTLTAIASKNLPSQALFRVNTVNSTWSGVPPSISEEVPKSPTSDSGSVFRSDVTTGSLTIGQPVFGEGNPALAVLNGKESKDASKRRKPKNNIVKSNSSFVSRVIPHEALQKRLAERSVDGTFAFFNINRALHWLDLSADHKVEPLTKILFTKAHALCHDVNQATKSTTHLDVVLGFNTSDMIWYEPMSQKYARLNKNGIINPSAVSSIYWLRNSENLFIAAHMDGTLVVYDKEKEDAPFIPEEQALTEDGHVNGKVDGEAPTMSLQILKSVQSRNQKTNPVAVWKVAKQKINRMAFSPDGTHLAVVSEDGTLKIIDFLKEKLVDVFRSYYGGLMSVTWSPDGRYILTGGQDDLVSIWSFADSALVARCQGHTSWVTDVKFDPWRCDERNYRFGSVGEDCRLLLWDFSVGMLGRPKAMSLRQRGSISSVPTTTTTTTVAQKSQTNLAEEGAANGAFGVHGVDSRATTAMLPPVMSKSIDDHPMSWLAFQQDCILTACCEGQFYTWDRPKEGISDGI